MKAFRTVQALSVLAAAIGLVGAGPVSGEIAGPFVANVTAASAVVWWQSAPAVGGRVVVGSRSFEDADPPFEVVIDGLEPGRAYAYRVEFANGDRRPAAGSYTLRTAPATDSSEPFRFAVMCDSRSTGPADAVNEPVLRRLLEDARARSAAFICFPGDMVYGYSTDADDYRRQLRQFKAVAAAVMAEVPIYVTMGNHDVLLHRTRDRAGDYDLDGTVSDGRFVTGETVFAGEFVNPSNGPPQPERPGAPPYSETSFSFEFGNAHFVFLNTNYWAATRVFPHRAGEPARLYESGNPEGRLMDGQFWWLADDLGQARTAGRRHLFVFGHEPAFPVGAHADDAMYYAGNATLSLKRDIRQRQQAFWRLLSDSRVLAAFFGDEHNYSRALLGPAGNADYDPPVWQIITGGAGAKPSDKRLMYLPWADSVRVFDSRHHYSLVSVRGDTVALEVYALPAVESAGSPTEMVLIDRVADLTVRD
jgi:hypothetical protein